MALLSIYRGTQAEVSERPVSDGALLFATDTKKIYLDKGSNRVEMSSLQDLSDYITSTQLSSAIGAEASARQKQDQLLEQAIDGKLGADDIIAGSNVQISHDDESGHITISATDTKDTNTTYTLTKSGSTITLNGSDGSKTSVTDANTTNSLSSFGVTATATELNYMDGVTSNVQTQLNGKAASSHNHSAADITSGTLSADRIPTITDGKIQSVSASKITGTIPQSALPSYVDDVLEYKNLEAFPDTGESGKIYVAQDTNKTYRWSGAAYVEISASLALGTTSSTAFRGDYGNTAYQHAAAKGSAFASGLYKITTNSQGHVTAATAVTKSDITALGIPGQDTNTTYGVASSSANGLMSATDKAKLDGIASGANKYTLPTASSSTLGGVKTGANITNSSGTISLTKANVTAALGYTPPTADTNTWIAFKGATTSAAGTAGYAPAPAAGAANRYLRSDGTWAVPPDTNTNTTYTLTKSGSTITLTGSDGKKTSVTDSNTTYSLSSFGITATAAEINKLDGLTATTAELNYVDGVTSNIQTQLNGKAASSHSHSNYLTTTGTAAAATKLATARTISLSGDASGSVAFNGTANVSIPATVLHHGTTSIGNNANLNSYTDPGWYYCALNATAVTISNSPTDNAFAMLVLQHAGTMQMVFEYMTSSYKIYVRNYYNEAWGSWQRLYTTANKPTASEIGAAAASHNHSAANITSGTLAVACGGTGITSNPSMLVNLGSTSAASVFAASPRPGITGTLAIAHGGTGATSAASARSNIGAAASDIIAVQSSQPSSSTCKLWIQIQSMGISVLCRYAHFYYMQYTEEDYD